MRRLAPIAVAGSIALHGLIAIYLATISPPKRTSNPIEITFLDPPTNENANPNEVDVEVEVENAPANAPASSTPQPPSRAASATPRSATNGNAEAATGPAAPTPGLLAFSGRAIGTTSTEDRLPDTVHLPSAGSLAAAVVADDPPPANPDTFGYHGVHIDDDKRDHGMVATGNGTYAHNRQTFVANVGRGGMVTFTDKPNVQLESAPRVIGGDTPGGGLFGFAGKFDITDAVMRAHGEDPYRYEKHKFLEETRELRMAMAEVDRRDRLQDALHDLPKLLERVWTQTTWPAVERRRMLFDLWDECAEEADDDATLLTALAVRATILTFIARRLPKDAVDGYPTDELKRLNNERHSRQAFDPYAAKID